MDLQPKGLPISPGTVDAQADVKAAATKAVHESM